MIEVFYQKEKRKLSKQKLQERHCVITESLGDSHDDTIVKKITTKESSDEMRV